MPRGRPVGATNKPKITSWKDTDKDPARVLLSIMRDEQQRPDLRAKAAAALMPFVHRRQPQALEIDGDLGGINVIIQQA